MRVHQWIKNVLVFAAPAAAGELLDPQVLRPTLLAVAAFCLASSAVYLVNDTIDREADARHPVKQHRPIASGELTPRFAVVLAVVLAVAAAVLAALASRDFLVLLAGYLVLQVLYSLWLKHEPVLDLAVVAVGFLLRAVGGGVAAGLPLSSYFLMVAGFGSLFIVAGKRYSELHTLGVELGTRRSLVRYSDSYLRFVWSAAAATTLMSYSLWAFEQSGPESWHAVSIVPFVLGLMRYAVDIDAGKAAEPEDIVFGDKVLQGIGVVWLTLLLTGVIRG